MNVAVHGSHPLARASERDGVLSRATLGLVGTGIDGQSRSCDVLAISQPDGLGDIANLA
jgi:hypothetical protein